MAEQRQSEGINLSALDSMVLSYMQCEELTEVLLILSAAAIKKNFQESVVVESGRELKKKCLAVRDLIADGEIDKAKELVRDLCPELLEV